MTLALALALLLAAPAHAGDDAPLSAMVPEVWRQTVFEVTCTDLRDCCGLDRDCGDWRYPAPDPAPVPLSPTLPLLTAAIAALIWKGSNRV